MEYFHHCITKLKLYNGFSKLRRFFLDGTMERFRNGTVRAENDRTGTKTNGTVSMQNEYRRSVVYWLLNVAILEYQQEEENLES